MLLLARCGRLDVEELCRERPRRDGAGRQGRGDLRVLQLGLPVHAARSRRGGGDTVGLTPRAIFSSARTPDAAAIRPSCALVFFSKETVSMKSPDATQETGM